MVLIIIITQKHFDLWHSFKTLTDPKSLPTRFNKIVRFIRIYDGTRYLPLFEPEKYVIYNRTRYLISLKSGITISHYFAKIKVESYDSLLIEKILT